MFELTLLQPSGVLPVETPQFPVSPQAMPSLGQNPDGNTLPPPNK